MAQDMNRASKKWARGTLALAAAVACGSLPAIASAASSTWTGASTTTTNWGDPTNWSAGVPGAVAANTDTVDANADVATFPAGLTTTHLVALDNSYNLTGISLSAVAASDAYTISPVGTSAFLLTSGGNIAAGGATAASTTAAPNPVQTIAAPIIVENAATGATAGSGAASFTTSLGTTTKTYGQLLLSGNITGAAATGATTKLTFNGASAGSQTGVISDSAAGGVTSVIIGGSGTGAWTLGGANTYTGTTSFIAGVQLNVGSINSTGAARVASSNMGAPTTAANGTIAFAGGTLNYTGTGETTDRLIGLGGGGQVNQSGTSGLLRFTGNLTNTGTGTTPKTFTLGGSAAGTGEFAGVIADSATSKTIVTKAGTGLWTLSGANTFTGAVNVTAGNLLLGSSTAAGLNNTVAGLATTAGSATATFSTTGNPLPAAVGSTIISPYLPADTYVTATSTTAGVTTLTLSAAATQTNTANATASAPIQVGAGTLNLNGQTESTRRIYVTAGATISNSNTTTPGTITTDIADQNGATPGTTDAYRLAGAGNLNIAGINGGVVSKTGAGTVTITPNAGTTNVIALTPVAGVVQMGEANALTNTSTLNLNGGTYGTGGFNQALASLTANTATDTIDLGLGNAGSILTFGSLVAFNNAGTTLTVNNWTGTAGQAGGPDQLVFTDTTNLTPTVLSAINFTGFGPGSQLVGNQVVPNSATAVPEPTSLAVVGLSLAGLAGRRRRGRN